MLFCEEIFNLYFLPQSLKHSGTGRFSWDRSGAEICSVLRGPPWRGPQSTEEIIWNRAASYLCRHCTSCLVKCSRSVRWNAGVKTDISVHFGEASSIMSHGRLGTAEQLHEIASRKASRGDQIRETKASACQTFGTYPHDLSFLFHLWKVCKDIIRLDPGEDKEIRQNVQGGRPAIGSSHLQPVLFARVTGVITSALHEKQKSHLSWRGCLWTSHMCHLLPKTSPWPLHSFRWLTWSLWLYLQKVSP